MLVPVAVVIMEVQDEHPPVRLAQDMNDGGVIRTGKCNRRREHGEGIGHDHQRRTPTS
jgi:hypothetical protein